MTNRGLLVATVTLVVANLLILGGVMRNRAGNPDAVVRLSERELKHWGDQSEGAEEILNLKLRWTMATAPDGAVWFDRARLEALGVTGLPAADDTIRIYGWREPSRQGFAVLELAGPAWVRWEAARQAAADSTAAMREVAMDALPDDAKPLMMGVDTAATRLMVVDFGLDPEALRQQYPERSRYLILPATYRPDVTPATRDSSGAITALGRVEGRISELLPGSVHVPRPLRDSLLGLGATRNDSTTHFEVTLKVGQKWEVWVE